MKKVLQLLKDSGLTQAVYDFVTSNTQYHNAHLSSLYYFEFPQSGYTFTGHYLNPLTGNYQARLNTWHVNNSSLSTANPWHAYIQQTGVQSGGSNFYIVNHYKWIDLVNWVNASGFVTVATSDTMSQINTAMQLYEGAENVAFTVHGTGCN